MTIGKRDRQVLLQAPAPVPQNEAGELGPPVYADQGLEFAQVLTPTPGAELTQAAQLVSVQPVQFVIRYRSDVRPTWQVVYNDCLHLVHAVTEIGRRQGLTLTTTNRGQAPRPSVPQPETLAITAVLAS